LRVLVIIPAYNESKNIKSVIESLKREAPQVDYIIVNDCSKDNTAQICKENYFNMVSHPINLGIGGGVQTGYIYALTNNYDIAIQMDGDGQHDPKFIKDLIRPIINDEADIVIGSRFINGEGFQSSRMRRMGIRFLSSLILFCCGAKVKDVTSGFRAVNKRFIELYANNYAQDYPEPEAIVFAKLMGARIKEVPVIMKERNSGKSSINKWKSIYYMIKVSMAILLYRAAFEMGD
jgi:glycosyltransferase involved in cell wall biosynthesis